VTARLTRYWVILWQHLGLNPQRADEWTLDEAIVAELFCEDYEADNRRRQAKARQGRR